MLFDIVIAAVTFVFLFIAAYCDLKSREVPDLLSYGLIFAALGLRGIFSPVIGWDLFLSGILGFVACFAVAWFLYKTNLWGGGDSKLLMGMGAVMGIGYPFTLSSFTLLWFFVLLLFLGSIYGLFWLFGLAFTRWARVKPVFLERLEQYKSAHYGFGLFSVMIVSFSFVNSLWLFLLFPAFIFYLFLFVTTIEEQCFVKRISPLKLTEGDWLDEEVIIDEERYARRRALELEDIEQLQAAHKRGKLATVIIREGVPFVPSFVFAYVVVLWGMPLAVTAGKMFLGL